MQEDTFSWQPAPRSEIARLARLLSAHLCSAGVPIGERPVERCRSIVREIVSRQQRTCFLAGGDDRFCWNHPKDRSCLFLKLEWGHRIPRSAGGTSELPNFILLCARCNNHIQTSRTLEQLVPELEHKLRVLKRQLREPE